MNDLANVDLANAFRIERTYDSSADFMRQVGKFVERRGTFFPLRKQLDKGTYVELSLRLPSGRMILQGKARVIKFTDANAKTPDGVWLKWENLSERSQKNVKLIEQWRKDKEN